MGPSVADPRVVVSTRRQPDSSAQGEDGAAGVDGRTVSVGITQNIADLAVLILDRAGLRLLQHGLCRRALARDARGKRCVTISREAARWSVLGAVHKELAASDVHPETEDKVYRAAVTALAQASGWDGVLSDRITPAADVVRAASDLCKDATVAADLCADARRFVALMRRQS